MYTMYIAEFWNTLSSVPIVLSGAIGLYNAIKFRYGVRFALPSLLMCFVGLGSVGFHGTLQYAGQVLDELSMVFCVTAYLFLVRGAGHAKGVGGSSAIVHRGSERAGGAFSVTLVPPLYTAVVGRQSWDGLECGHVRYMLAG